MPRFLGVNRGSTSLENLIEHETLMGIRMPQVDFRSPRLFIDSPLTTGGTLALDRNQGNYLGNVLRLGAGDPVLVFNGRDGEWRAVLAGRKRPDHLILEAQTRAKLAISLQASSGGALRAPAALISPAFFSASCRNGRKCFMHSSLAGGPACCCGPEAPPKAPGPPITGAAPAWGNAVPVAPFTGGNAGSGALLLTELTGGKGDELAGAAWDCPGSGAGNAP